MIYQFAAGTITMPLITNGRQEIPKLFRLLG
jgi:hypothetical protein